MRSVWRSWTLALLVAAVFFFGVLRLFNRQFASGEAYPAFSSMRTDRMGTKLLFDSLSQLPGTTVERNFRPLEFLPPDGLVLVLAGLNPLSVNWNEGLLLRTSEQIAERGNRVVLAMHLDPETHLWQQQEFERREDTQTRDSKRTLKSGDPPLKSMWKISIKLDPDSKRQHRLYFGQADGWEIRDRAGDKVLAVERSFGKGSIVLSAEAADFTNESVVRLDRLPQVCTGLGAYRRIVFDEQHLGLAESGSVVGMVRQFRLTGLALGLGICAVLFIWKNASGFPPPALQRQTNHSTGRTSHAGLLTLLKRHIAPSELAAVCWRQWLSTNQRQATPELRRRAETILASASGRPLEATREIQALLRDKGEL